MLGQIFALIVTCRKDGSVWRSDIYTDDSNISVTAVHAGIINNGETNS